MIKSAGGIPRGIPLKPTKKGIISSADWKLDPKEFERLFNNKTKMLILNTPHNPLGKVFNMEELTMIADLCKKWNVLVVSDEVYAHQVFEPIKHIRICTLPDMWERTLTIGSAGKTFSVTGWKLGWTYGPKNLIRNMQLVHQNSVYTCATPLQEAVARGFELELERFNSSESYLNSLAVELKEKRDTMATFLTEAGFEPTIPEAGYFMIADWSHLADKVDLSNENDTLKDYRFTKWMTKNISLQGIPPSAFYTKENKKLGEDYVRFCYFKKDETLQQASDILKNWYKKIHKL
jgi:kynurenine--oxoglutarate transaminase/cysteine-S-conjugate beta-lyase/glutamine--phenylpyruvate transaminase